MMGSMTQSKQVGLNEDSGGPLGCCRFFSLENRSYGEMATKGGHHC